MNRGEFMCVNCNHSLASSIKASYLDELVNEGKYQKRIEDDEGTKKAREAYALDDSFSNAIALGSALAFQMRYHEALLYFEKAKEMDPSSYLAHRKCAGRYFSTLQLEKAAEEFSWCIAHADDKLDPLYMLGCVKYCQGEFKKAEESFKECLDLAKDDADMYVGVLYWLVACSIRMNEDYSGIIATFDESMKIGHHTGYLETLKLFKNGLFEENHIESENEIQRCIFAYGVHLYYLSEQNCQKADEYLDKALSLDTYFASFAYLAAYCEKNRF